jgi:hypothetical protein
MGNLINQIGGGLGAGAQSAINQQIALQNLQEQIAGKLGGQISALEKLDPEQRALGLELSGVKQGAGPSFQEQLLAQLLGIPMGGAQQPGSQFPNLFPAAAVPAGATPGINPNAQRTIAAPRQRPPQQQPLPDSPVGMQVSPDQATIDAAAKDRTAIQNEVLFGVYAFPGEENDATRHIFPKNPNDVMQLEKAKAKRIR